ncbi:MAG: transcriptional regulator [Gemmatimonadetes bacterium]|nr:transcriptional regulator [Gemmatimonadota bacterium]
MSSRTNGNTDVTSIGIAFVAGRSGRSDDAHLAAALTSELTRQLLSARATTRSSGQDPTPRGLLAVRLSDGGAVSDVDLSMTGYVFRDDSLLRAVVKVTRTRDGSVLWSDSRSRPIRELPTLARIVASEVASRVGAHLTTPPPPVATEKSTQVYELILRGTYLRSRYAPDDLESAIAFFDQAIKLDPTSARARDLRETAQLRLLTWGGAGGEVEARLLAHGMLRRVLDRDRDESERLVDEADAELRDGQYAHACKLLNAAIDNDARSAPAYALRSMIRTRGGQVREAFADAETVTQLGRPLWGNALRAMALRRAGDATEARKETRRLVLSTRTRRALSFWDARMIATALAGMGDANTAQTILARVSRDDPRLVWVRDDPSIVPAGTDARAPRRLR